MVGSNDECDWKAGEVYRDQSPGKLADLEACKQSCAADPACESITFLPSRWCSHYSTSCANTKYKKKAVSMTLRVKPTWVLLGLKVVCDTNSGEVYLRQSSGTMATLQACQKSCEDAPQCKAVTHFADNWCGHYSTSCTKTLKHGKALSSWRVVRY